MPAVLISYTDMTVVKGKMGGRLSKFRTTQLSDMHHDAGPAAIGGRHGGMVYSAERPPCDDPCLWQTPTAHPSTVASFPQREQLTTSRQTLSTGLLTS